MRVNFLLFVALEWITDTWNASQVSNKQYTRINQIYNFPQGSVFLFISTSFTANFQWKKFFFSLLSNSFNYKPFFYFTLSFPEKSNMTIFTPQPVEVNKLIENQIYNWFLRIYYASFGIFSPSTWTSFKQYFKYFYIDVKASKHPCRLDLGI